MRQLNWGIIGCGNVTERKSGPAFNKVEGSHLVAVMRRNAALAKDYADRHHVPHWYSDADDLINDPGVNAIYISTPPASHAEYAIKAMQCGKIAYVEKPMAATYEACIKMLKVSEETGIPLFIAYYRRYLPYFMRVKELIDSGVLGKILYFSVDFHIPPHADDFKRDDLPWRVRPEIAGAGYFYDLACHQLDLFEWFFGMPDFISGNAYNRGGLYDAEDTVFASLLYGKEVPFAGHWCFCAGNDEHHDIIRVHGTNGSLEFSTFDFTPMKLEVSGKAETFLPENPENIQYWFIKDMVSKLQQHDAGNSGNGASASRTNLIMDQILGKIK
jgi:predicted dehydrogenase